MWILLVLAIFCLSVIGWSLHFAALGHLVGCRFQPEKPKKTIATLAVAGTLFILAVQSALEPLIFTIPVWMAILILGPAPLGFTMFYLRYEAWNVGVRNTYFKPRD